MPPVPSNNLRNAISAGTLEDSINMESLSPANAVYIKKDLHQGKIMHVYSKRTINQILAHTKKSPFYGHSIARSDIRKLSNHSLAYPATPAPAAQAPAHPEPWSNAARGNFGSASVIQLVKNYFQSHPTFPLPGKIVRIAYWFREPSGRMSRKSSVMVCAVRPGTGPVAYWKVNAPHVPALRPTSHALLGERVTQVMRSIVYKEHDGPPPRRPVMFAGISHRKR